MPDINKALRRDNKRKQNSGRVRNSTDEFYDKRQEKNKTASYNKRRKEKEEALKETV